MLGEFLVTIQKLYGGALERATEILARENSYISSVGFGVMTESRNKRFWLVIRHIDDDSLVETERIQRLAQISFRGMSIELQEVIKLPRDIYGKTFDCMIYRIPSHRDPQASLEVVLNTGKTYQYISVHGEADFPVSYEALISLVRERYNFRVVGDAILLLKKVIPSNDVRTPDRYQFILKKVGGNLQKLYLVLDNYVERSKEK